MRKRMGMGMPSSQRRIYPVAPASFIRWVNFMIGSRFKMESNARGDLHVHPRNFVLPRLTNSARPCTLPKRERRFTIVYERLPSRD